MRTSQWTLLVASLMFVASIWFVLAASRGVAAMGTGAPAAKPFASVRQLMTGIVQPAADTVYKSVSIVVTAEGETEHFPRSPEEWEAIVGAATALVESGELLKNKEREGAHDTEPWVKISQEMMDAAKVSLKAAQDRSKEGMLASGERLNRSCNDCHQLYAE